MKLLHSKFVMLRDGFNTGFHKNKNSRTTQTGYKPTTSSDKPELYEAFQQTLSMPPKNNNNNKNWDIDALPKSSTFDPNHSQKLSNQIK